jgi:hypothetical protein
MSETITKTVEDDGRTDADAVQEMYTQALNTGTLDEQKETLEAMAAEVGTTLDALAEAQKSRNKAASDRLASSAVDHYLKNDANADSWVRTKTHEE